MDSRGALYHGVDHPRRLPFSPLLSISWSCVCCCFGCFVPRRSNELQKSLDDYREKLTYEKKKFGDSRIVFPPPMQGTIPQGALPASILVLIYSFICLILCLLVVGLLFSFGERWTYVIMLATFTAISSIASIIQQFYYAFNWETIKEAEYEKALLTLTQPSLALSGPAETVEIVLFEIQFYCYNAMSCCVLFWAGALFCGTWEIGSRRLGTWVLTAPLVSKLFVFIWPGVIIGLTDIPGVMNNTALYFVVSNITMLTSLTGGSIMLILILYKYMKTRRLVTGSHRGGWWASKDTNSRSDNTGTMESNATDSGRETRRSIYDRALVTRFTIGFVVLAIFEGTTIAFSENQSKNYAATAKAGSPDFSVSNCISEILFFLPGVSASLLVFLVFGTAKSWRQYRGLVVGLCGARQKFHELSRRRKVANLDSERDTPAFEFERLPSLRTRQEDDAETKGKELETRVRMFSGSSSGPEEPLSIVEPWSGKSRSGPRVQQFHMPLRPTLQRPAPVVRSTFNRKDSHDHTMQYGSIIREDDGDKKYTRNFNPHDFLDDSSGSERG